MSRVGVRSPQGRGTPHHTPTSHHTFATSTHVLRTSHAISSDSALIYLHSNVHNGRTTLSSIPRYSLSHVLGSFRELDKQLGCSAKILVRQVGVIPRLIQSRTNQQKVAYFPIRAIRLCNHDKQAHTDNS